ncbi:MAG: hypothetical protein ABIO78_04265 [Thermoanaerobaculia bacterium]
MPRAPLALIALLLTIDASAQSWTQWGGNSRHEGNSSVVGNSLFRIDTEMVLDPFVELSKAQTGGTLLVHYPVPLVSGDEVVVVVKSGSFTSLATPQTQIWNVLSLRTSGRQLLPRWSYQTDWKPVPMGTPGAPSWEPVYHVVMTDDAVWAPGAGGTIDRISRATGVRVGRINPFGTAVDPNTYVTGPPVVDGQGNIYYNVMQFAADPNPWQVDPAGAWLVRVAPNGTATRATFASLTPNAPPANGQCTLQFNSVHPLPWPPSRDAVAPATRCGAQRPGINVSPAIGSDGTVYTISRGHLNDRWGFLVAANADLSPKWSATLRNRLSDGCNVNLPANGSPGGCRDDATTGVDPMDNQPGSGRVLDVSTSSPVVLPDGNIIYGAYSRYNYSQGHLMMFDTNGSWLRAYGFGWDLTPSVYRHGNTYSIVLKENRYSVSSYCSPPFCPFDRTSATPNDPEQYLITQLNPNLEIEWQYRNRETRSCGRDANGGIQCSSGNNQNGFEWCVNAVAVDSRGVVYANSEDGHVYALHQDGRVERLFLRLALFAAYTPLSIMPDGRILTQNDGRLFVVSGPPKRRAAIK